ncbi:MAG TPA: hypothetical protein VJS69_02480, partial [Candidatus Krumholzibacteria bacterium]|nr:hypothetical protein [Candidatus Krumholzibacteria bacterium]
MRISVLLICLALVFFVTTGVSECYPPGGGSTGKTCNGEACRVVIHLDNKCDPVDASGTSMESCSVNPGDAVCYLNDAQCTFRLTFPPVLFGLTHQEVTLKAGECVRLTVQKHAGRKTIGYQIACDCSDQGGGHGNPEFKVGGGSGGGG